MTNYAEMISEAEGHDADMCATYPKDAVLLFKRLAAALRELAPPEGWRVTELTHDASGAVVRDGKSFGPFANLDEASAAMAALDGRE